MLSAGELNRWVTFTHRTVTETDPIYGTPIYGWADFAAVWANVQDKLPSRAEQIADGISIANRPCRVRIRYRSDLDSSMRLKIGERTLRIIAGPAELGLREGVEFMAEELSTEGQEP